VEHVFVETNFVVDWAAPAHFRVPAAVALVERAVVGEIALHIPAICLREARPVLQSERYQPRADVDPIREFLHGTETTVDPTARDAAFRALTQYEQYMKKALAEVPDRIDSLRTTRGVDVFAATDAILTRSIDLIPQIERVTPFDLAVLASILVRAEELRASGDGFSFCERDADLQPWGAKGGPKPWLQKLYDDAQVWVFSDFTMTTPPKPEGWPGA
jgi:hypothetical protein